jgi:hypothetical protein
VLIVSEVERLHWRIWNGSAKDAKVILKVNQRRRHLFARRHARRSVVIGRGRIYPWLGTLAWSDQAATAP